MVHIIIQKSTLAILSALNGKKIPVYGNGEQIRDWLYVEDHARALLNVFNNGLPERLIILEGIVN